MSAMSLEGYKAKAEDLERQLADTQRALARVVDRERRLLVLLEDVRQAWAKFLPASEPQWATHARVGDIITRSSEQAAKVLEDEEHE